MRWALNKIGDDLFPIFLEVQWADNSAKSEFGLDDKFDRVQAVSDVYDDVLKNRDCVKLSDLAINGNDVLALGVTGKEVGRILNLALKLVVEDPDMNEHDSLVAFAKHEIEKNRS